MGFVLFFSLPFATATKNTRNSVGKRLILIIVWACLGFVAWAVVLFKTPPCLFWLRNWKHVHSEVARPEKVVVFSFVMSTFLMSA